MQKAKPSIIVTLIVMAIILAIGSILALSYLQRRPELPDNSYQTTVEDVVVVINMDPAKRVRLVNPPPVQADLQPGDQTTEPSAAPSAQDQQPAPTETVPTPEPTAVPRPDPVIFIDYVVQPNEYLYDIALRLDTSIALMAQEGIDQADLIAGQTIKLPVGNPDYCPGRRPYAVGENDTAYSISHRLNVTVEELREINNLDDNYTVYAGGILCVP